MTTQQENRYYRLKTEAMCLIFELKGTKAGIGAEGRRYLARNTDYHALAREMLISVAHTKINVMDLGEESI